MTPQQRIELIRKEKPENTRLRLGLGAYRYRFTDDHEPENRSRGIVWDAIEGSHAGVILSDVPFEPEPPKLLDLAAEDRAAPGSFITTFREIMGWSRKRLGDELGKATSHGTCYAVEGWETLESTPARKSVHQLEQLADRLIAGEL